MGRWLWCLLPYSLAACAASGGEGEGGGDVAVVSDEVVIEGLEAFGPVGSAYWYRRASDARDWAVLTTVPDACRKFRLLLEAEDAIAAAEEEASPDTWCREMREEVVAWAEAYSALNPAGSRRLKLVADGSDDFTWQVGTYITDATLASELRWIDEDVYEDFAARWDDDGTQEDNCGVTTDEDWGLGALPDGTLEILEVVDEDYVWGEMDAAIETNEGTGTLTAAFTAEWCEVPY